MLVPLVAHSLLCTSTLLSCYVTVRLLFNISLTNGCSVYLALLTGFLLSLFVAVG